MIRAAGSKSSIPSRRVQSRAARAISSWPEIQQQVIATTLGDEHQSRRHQSRSTSTFGAADFSPVPSKRREDKKLGNVPAKKAHSTPEERGTIPTKSGCRTKECLHTGMEPGMASESRHESNHRPRGSRWRALSRRRAGMGWHFDTLWGVWLLRSPQMERVFDSGTSVSDVPRTQVTVVFSPKGECWCSSDSVSGSLGSGNISEQKNSS